MTRYSEGGRSSKYYFALEKSRSLRKTMCGVYVEDGTITRNSVKILKEQSKFFKKLYKSNPEIQF